MDQHFDVGISDVLFRGAADTTSRPPPQRRVGEPCRADGRDAGMIERVLRDEDLNIVYGDTNVTLACALAAKL